MAKPVDLTFVEHLEELRKRLLISLGAILAGSLAVYLYSDPALRFLVVPLRNETGSVYFFSPQEAFVTKIKVALFLGLVGSSPVVFGQLWLFVSPALTGKEKKFFLPMVFVTSLLFTLGVVFSFFVVMPMALRFLVGMQPDFLKPMISISEYVTFLSGMSLAFGIGFNMPVVILALAASGLVRARDLNHYHRHAIVLIFIAAAVLTPGPDVASQLLLAIPLLVLFEVSLWAATLFEHRKGR